MDVWPQKIEPEEIKIGWRRLVRKVFIDPEGTEREYYTKDSLHAASVAVIALTPNHTVVISEQFRPGPERVFQEIPGGGCEPGETLEAAARRELEEETGYAVDTMTYLGKTYKNAYTNATNHYFLGRHAVHQTKPHTDEGEFIQVREISIQELIKNAKEAHMTDAEAVLLAYDMLKKYTEKE